MPTLRIETWSGAPAEVCFPLARSVDDVRVVERGAYLEHAAQGRGGA